jgi:hypothetical protein
MSRYIPLDGMSDRNSTTSVRPGSSRPSTSGFSSRNLNGYNNAGSSSYPDSREMNAAFDMSDDDEDDDAHQGDRRGLLSQSNRNENRRSEQQFAIGNDDSDEDVEDLEGKPFNPVINPTQSRVNEFDDPLRNHDIPHQSSGNVDRGTERMPGSYDFERDFVSVLFLL